MRVNVYTEELTREVKIVRAEYTRFDGTPGVNYGIRFILKSSPDLHQPPKDDDRSAVTLWCGSEPVSMMKLLNDAIEAVDLGHWESK